MHFLVGILLGLLFENAGIDGGKTINNIGFCIVTLVYLSYTSIMPAILKCEYKLMIRVIISTSIAYLLRVYIMSTKLYFYFSVPSELHILRKELFNNWYKLSTYFVAFLVTNMPLQVSQPEITENVRTNIFFYFINTLPICVFHR